VHLLLAGPIIAGETLSRFFTLHVFMIPGLIIAIVSMHLRLVLTKGINEYPTPGKPVRKATYDAEYADIMRKEGVPFVPHAIGKDLIFAALVIIGILGAAFVFGPKGPGGPPNPTLVDTNPRPDFYFLSIFAALALLPDWMEVLILFVAPAVCITLLLALPFISPTGEKSALRRPVAVLSVIFVMLVISVLTYMGETSPWSPVNVGLERGSNPGESLSETGRRSSCEAHWCFRTSSAAIVIPWEAWGGNVVPRWTKSPLVLPRTNWYAR
jgi:ubiquinol-cytochrome c reductase cytochrome b subunit